MLTLCTSHAYIIIHIQSYCSVSISGMTIQYNLSDRIKNLFRDEHRNPTVDLVRLLTSTSETEVLAVDSCGRVFFKHYEPADDGNGGLKKSRSKPGLRVLP